MRYFFLDGTYIPKHCIYGPRPREALFLNDWEWQSINDNLTRWRREREIAEAYAAKERNKRDLSYGITKNWQNTLASIKTQSEQRRIEKRERDKQEKIDKYNEILESRKEGKKPILAAARKIIFEGKDSTRTLFTALERCAVLTEREKQIEFKNGLKEETAKREADFFEKMNKDVEDYEREVKEFKMKEAEGKRNYSRSLTKQMEERRKLAEESVAKTLRAEKEDIAKMTERLEKMTECEEKDKRDGIRRLRMNYDKSYFATELEKSLAAEEEEENEVNRMINKYAKRFATERARKEADMIAESIRNREKMTEILARGMGKKENKDEEIYERAVRETEKELARKVREKEGERQKAKMEMAAWESEHRKKVAAEREAKRVTRKWTILQNERKREVDRDWERERKRRVEEEKTRTREGYAMQMMEKRELEEERRKRDEVEGTAGEDRDAEELLKYCDDVVEYARARGWKEYPVVAAAARLKKELGPPPAVEQEKEEPPKQERQKCGRPTGVFCYCFKN